MPGGWGGRLLHAVLGWKESRASWNVVSGRQPADHAVPWPQLTDKEPEPLSSRARPRSCDWLAVGSKKHAVKESRGTDGLDEHSTVLGTSPSSASGEPRQFGSPGPQLPGVK